VQHIVPYTLTQWDTSTSSWVKIGDVVDAVGSNRKQLHEGKEYDYVFDVDIKDGAPPLKLPYNVTGKFASRLSCDSSDGPHKSSRESL
jgi:PFU (PLAA family ubiquitin binding)